MNNTQIKNGGAVTAQYDFFPSTREGEKLFSVRAGIPLSDAFDQLTVLLSSSHAAVNGIATSVSDGDDPDACWATVHLMDFAYALVQSMHHGYNDHARHNPLRPSVD